jgi:hypothetical protein
MLRRVVLWLDTSVSEGRAAFIFRVLKQWRWGQYGPSKGLYPAMTPRGTTAQKITISILTVVKNWNLASEFLPFYLTFEMLEKPNIFF